jgi:hypothetical protein
MKTLTIEQARMVAGAGGGGGDQQSSTQRLIPDELKGAASAYSGMVTNLADRPFQAYTGQGVADLNGMQTGAMNMIQNRAMNGSPVMDQANQTLTGFMQGGQTNPYLDQMVNKAQQSVAQNFNTMTKPALETAGVNSGSFGNSGIQERMGLQQKAAAQQMGDIATSMYGNAYNTDQSNKMQALGMAPTFGNQAYTDATQLMNAGNTAQQNDQSKADFGYQQYQNQQNYPLQQINAVGGGLNNMSGTTTTTKGGGK